MTYLLQMPEHDWMSQGPLLILGVQLKSQWRGQGLQGQVPDLDARKLALKAPLAPLDPLDPRHHV